jgi:protein lifeguard
VVPPKAIELAMSVTASPYPYAPVHADVEKGDTSDVHWQFAERAVRTGFVRKVFGLLGLQLALTAAVASVFVCSASAKAFISSKPWLLMASMITSLVIVVVLSFSESARRSYPKNMVLLFAFTLAESILVGAISARYDTTSVVIAAALTAGITVSLSLYAMRTKNDFTAAGGFLFSLCSGLIMLMLIGIFVKTTMFNLIVSGMGALLFSAYIVYDVQTLMGGQHKFSVSPDEYIFGAIAIYLDIINLFIHLLQLLSSRND